MVGVTGDIGSEDMDLIDELILNSPSVSSSSASDYQESGDRDDCSDKCCGYLPDEKIEKVIICGRNEEECVLYRTILDVYQHC